MALRAACSGILNTRSHTHTHTLSHPEVAELSQEARESGLVGMWVEHRHCKESVRCVCPPIQFEPRLHQVVQDWLHPSHRIIRLDRCIIQRTELMDWPQIPILFNDEPALCAPRRGSVCGDPGFQHLRDVALLPFDLSWRVQWFSGSVWSRSRPSWDRVANQDGGIKLPNVVQEYVSPRE